MCSVADYANSLHLSSKLKFTKTRKRYLITIRRTLRRIRSDLQKKVQVHRLRPSSKKTSGQSVRSPSTTRSSVDPLDLAQTPEPQGSPSISSASKPAIEADQPENDPDSPIVPQPLSSPAVPTITYTQPSLVAPDIRSSDIHSESHGQFGKAKISSDAGVEEIKERAKSASLYWSTHLEQVDAEALEWDQYLISILHEFLTTHLLHWLECLSVLGELRSGVDSLRKVKSVTAKFQSHVNTQQKKSEILYPLANDGLRMVHMSFDAIEKHCFEVYHSGLIWIPKKCMLREVYAAVVPCAPKVVMGLPDFWDPTELDTHCGSDDNTVRTSTGQAEVKMDTRGVRLVAFSSHGTQIMGQAGTRFKYWNAVTGEPLLRSDQFKNLFSISSDKRTRSMLSHWFTLSVLFKSSRCFPPMAKFALNLSLIV